MKNIKLGITFLLLFFCCSEVYCSEQIVSQSDSLILSKVHSRKKAIILSGEKIKIKRHDNSKVAGDFLSIDEGVLTIQSNDEQVEILIDDLKSIKTYSSSIGQFTGKALVVLGAAGMVFGGISLVAGLAALSSDGLGSLVLFAVPVLAGGGYGVYSLGNRLIGKKYDLKKWRVE